ncbi:MAG TPA: reverse transcriptase domain-containing protein [Candidatus Binatia bacterium]|nr:reverse transcriptase domain-containing protein [Candidatus Binatia bacterium]
MVQGALKLILEPIFEADFQPGSFGYRPKKSAHAAIQRVSKAILEGKTYVIDFDLRSYFDTVRHHVVLEKVARRIDDDAVLWLLKLLLDTSGKQGVPQGGVMTPRTQKVTWGRRGSGRATGVRSGRSGVAGLSYRNGMAQRDRISVDENLLHQESKDLLALSHIQCIGTPPQLPAECGQGFGEL